ncbi:MAG TPA: hypothetical protein EYG57_13425 [Planctomycetes bacterium]|nr:hypothetical protein [Planctomycetota bacterium]
MTGRQAIYDASSSHISVSFCLLRATLLVLLPLLLIVLSGCGGRHRVRQEITEEFNGEARQLGLRIYGVEARLRRLEEDRRSDASFGSSRRFETDGDSEEPDENLVPPDVDLGPAGTGLEADPAEGAGDPRDMGFNRRLLNRTSAVRLHPTPSSRTFDELAGGGSGRNQRTNRWDGHTVVQQIVSRLRIGNSSGSRDFDGELGDDGMSILVQPLDQDGEVLAVPGPISVELMDSEGRAHIARWEFSRDEVEQAFSADNLGVGYRLDMSWKGEPPSTDQLHVFVRYHGPGGGNWQADLPLTPNLAPNLAAIGEGTRVSRLTRDNDPPIDNGWSTRSRQDLPFGDSVHRGLPVARPPGDRSLETSTLSDDPIGLPDLTGSDTGPSASVYDGTATRAAERQPSLEWRATR